MASFSEKVAAEERSEGKKVNTWSGAGMKGRCRRRGWFRASLVAKMRLTGNGSGGDPGA